MRTKSISYFDAGLICSMRIDQSREGVVLPLPEFADKLLRDGYITKPVRRVTLWRILTGRYYPGLKFEGVPIDFSLMPDNVRGVSREDQLRHGLHDVKGGFHELRQEARDTASELRERLAQLNARIDERDTLIAVQDARIAALERLITVQWGVNAAPVTVIDAAGKDEIRRQIKDGDFDYCEGSEGAR